MLESPAPGHLIKVQLSRFHPRRNLLFKCPHSLPQVSGSFVHTADSSSQPNLRALLDTAQITSAGQSPAWLTLCLPVGQQSRVGPQGSGGSARPWTAQTGPEGDVQRELEEQKVGQFPCPCLRGSLFHPPSAGVWKGAVQPPPRHWHWGISSHLSQLSLHLEVSQYLQRSQKQSKPHIIHPQEPSSPLLPLLHSTGEEPEELSLDQTGAGGGGQLS
jgi:hypothetical protein